MNITLPELSLVVLIGVSDSGKSTFARKYFKPTEGRKPLVALTREYHLLPVAIVLNMPEKLCHERNRLDRIVPSAHT